MLGDSGRTLLDQLVAPPRSAREGGPDHREGHTAVRALRIEPGSIWRFRCAPVHFPNHAITCFQLPNHAITCFPRIEARVDHLTGPITMLAAR